MGTINFKRVVLGGLITGVVLNIGEALLNEVFLVRQMEETARRLHIDRPGAPFIVVATVLTLLLGIVIVLMYAFMRTRLGPGPKTAAVAGLIAWFSVYVYAGILSAILIAVPTTLMLVGVAWGLIEYLLAAIIGARFYREV